MLTKIKRGVTIVKQQWHSKQRQVPRQTAAEVTLNLNWRKAMSKDHDIKKDTKKKAGKTLMEKRLAKKAKKAGK
jgi:hypothetical protein